MINQTYVALVSDIMREGENALLTARQRRVGPGGDVMQPSVIVATDKRLIIRSNLLRIKTNVEVIPYPAIAFVKLQRGVVSSTVVIGTRSAGGGGNLGSETNMGMTTEISGLRYKDAVDLIKLINDTLDKLGEEARRGGGAPAPQPQALKPVVCAHCKFENPPGSRFCAHCGFLLV